MMTDFVTVARPLSYNERKLRNGEAECIAAANFLKQLDQLTLEEKKQRFADQAELNHRALKTARQFILEFDPADKVDNRQLRDIAAAYMQCMGFGDQPYLVYRHTDTAFPHIHIVTITVRPDGKTVRIRIPIGQALDTARESIEKQFGLLNTPPRLENIHPGSTPARKVEYGKVPTGEAIATTLQYVLNHYRYRSAPELNAILGLYNLKAITGRPTSRLHRHGGLLYQILDKNGKGRSAPIKASALPGKPTLRWLQTKFTEYEVPDAKAVRNTRLALDAVLRDTAKDSHAFSHSLRRNQLALSPDLSPDQTVTGLLIVNIADRVVLRAGELGPGYDLPPLRQKLGFDPLHPSLAPEANQQMRQRRQQNRSL